jgi:hypothetical protein
MVDIGDNNIVSRVDVSVLCGCFDGVTNMLTARSQVHAWHRAEGKYQVNNYTLSLKVDHGSW